MSGSYTYVPLPQLRTGMVLSDDLLDSNGNVLLARGMELTAAMMTSLQRHAVAAVPIACGAPEQHVLSEIRKHDAQRLARLFRKPGSDDTDATGILHQYVRHFRLGAQE
jgi:hypothetical protein